ALERRGDAGDLDIEISPQRRTNLGVLDTIGNRQHPKLWKALAVLGHPSQANCAERSGEGPGVFAMACETPWQAFLRHNSERFVERVVHHDWRSMVIKPLGAPITLDHREIEVPRARFRLAVP